MKHGKLTLETLDQALSHLDVPMKAEVIGAIHKLRIPCSFHAEWRAKCADLEVATDDPAEEK